MVEEFPKMTTPVMLAVTRCGVLWFILSEYLIWIETAEELSKHRGICPLGIKVLQAGPLCGLFFCRNPRLGYT